MKAYLDKNYGSDIDGNRGTDMWFCELEPSDDTEIIRQIREKLIGYEEEDYPETVEIIIDDFEFIVDVKDYV